MQTNFVYERIWLKEESLVSECPGAAARNCIDFKIIHLAILILLHNSELIEHFFGKKYDS